MNSVYYIATIKSLESGEYLSTRQMLAELEGEPWFDINHAKAEIQKAYNDYNYETKSTS